MLEPNTATIQLKYIGDRYVDYMVIVKVADDLGFVEERHVWGGDDWDRGLHALGIARKTLGAIRNLRVDEL